MILKKILNSKQHIFESLFYGNSIIGKAYFNFHLPHSHHIGISNFSDKLLLSLFKRIIQISLIRSWHL